MAERKPLKSILISKQEREEFLRSKLAQSSPEEMACEWIDASSWQNDLNEKNPEEYASVFLDANLIVDSNLAYQVAWSPWNFVLIGEGFKTKAFSTWRAHCSYLNLSGLDEADFKLAFSIAQAQENWPGIFVLTAPGAEVYFQKVQALHDVGEKVDRFVALLEEKHKNLAPQFFNLRQLSYSILHQALTNSASSSKFSPVVDFQIAADDKKICFAARFNAPLGSLLSWREAMAKGISGIWNAAQSCSDLLVITELVDLNQVEIKALVCQKGDFAALKSSLLVRSISDFSPNVSAIERQKAAKFTALDRLPSVAREAIRSGEQEGPSGPREPSEARSPDLGLKLKADMLENEKANLQGLVKKKSQLISGLTKDVNRAQQEVIAAQKNATKEILKIRMEMERAKNENRDMAKKMASLQKRLTEKEELEKSEKEEVGEKRDFEKDWKVADLQRRSAEERLAEANTKLTRLEEMLQRQRKETVEASAEVNDLRAKNQKLEHSLATQRAEVKAPEKPKPAAPEVGGKVPDENLEKIKELRKQYSDTKTKEVELEKEVKRLSLKSEAAEKNLKVNAAAAMKQLEAAEKALEDAKRQKTEASNKLEEMRVEVKKKIEESNQSERQFKKKADDLAESLRVRNLEFEKQVKQIAELQRKLDEPNRKAS